MVRPVMHDGVLGLGVVTESVLLAVVVLAVLGLVWALWWQRRAKHAALRAAEKERVARRHAEQMAHEAVRLRRQEEALARGEGLRPAAGRPGRAVGDGAGDVGRDVRREAGVDAGQDDEPDAGLAEDPGWRTRRDQHSPADQPSRVAEPPSIDQHSPADQPPGRLDRRDRA